MHPWLRALQKHRRRIATLVVVVGVLVVGGRLFDAVPRDVHLRLRFGPDHAAVREAYSRALQHGLDHGEGPETAFAVGALTVQGLFPNGAFD